MVIISKLKRKTHLKVCIFRLENLKIVVIFGYSQIQIYKKKIFLLQCISISDENGPLGITLSMNH